MRMLWHAMRGRGRYSWRSWNHRWRGWRVHLEKRKRRERQTRRDALVWTTCGPGEFSYPPADIQEGTIDWPQGLFVETKD